MGQASGQHAIPSTHSPQKSMGYGGMRKSRDNMAGGSHHPAYELTQQLNAHHSKG